MRIATIQPVRKNKSGTYQRTVSKWKPEIEVANSIKVGDIITTNVTIPEKTNYYHNGFIHGLIYGDGTQDRVYKNGDYRYRMRLCGAKIKYVHLFQNVTYPPFAKGDATIWLRSPYGGFKRLPKGSEDSNYIAGFIDGWVATDGTSANVNTIHIYSTKENTEAWMKQFCSIGGWQLRSINIYKPTGSTYAKEGVMVYDYSIARPSEYLAWRVLDLQEHIN